MPLFEVGDPDVDRAPRDVSFALDHAASFGLADRGKDVLGPLELPDPRFQLGGELARPLQAIALGRGHADFVFALIVARDQRDAHDSADRGRAVDHNGRQGHDQKLVPHRRLEHDAISAVDQSVKDA